MKIITIKVDDDVQPKVFKALADSDLPLVELMIQTPKPPRVRAKKGEQVGNGNTPSPKS